MVRDTNFELAADYLTASCGARRGDFLQRGDRRYHEGSRFSRVRRGSSTGGPPPATRRVSRFDHLFRSTTSPGLPITTGEHTQRLRSTSRMAGPPERAPSSDERASPGRSGCISGPTTTRRLCLVQSWTEYPYHIVEIRNDTARSRGSGTRTSGRGRLSSRSRGRRREPAARVDNRIPSGHAADGTPRLMTVTYADALGGTSRSSIASTRGSENSGRSARHGRPVARRLTRPVQDDSRTGARRSLSLYGHVVYHGPIRRSAHRPAEGVHLPIRRRGMENNNSEHGSRGAAGTVARGR